jgi:membrane-bound lytic murein transglycosylase MltF
MASQARKLPIQANLSLTEVVNHLEKHGDLAASDALLQANGVSMASSAFDLKALKEELLDRKSKARADEMTNLRSKQMHVSKSNRHCAQWKYINSIREFMSIAFIT